MNAAQLLPLVQQAQASGMQYLVLPNHYIPVDEALRWKASCEEKLVTACNYIEQYRCNPTQYGVNCVNPKTSSRGLADRIRRDDSSEKTSLDRIVYPHFVDKRAIDDPVKLNDLAMQTTFS